MPSRSEIRTVFDRIVDQLEDDCLQMLRRRHLTTLKQQVAAVVAMAGSVSIANALRDEFSERIFSGCELLVRHDIMVYSTHPTGAPVHIDLGREQLWAAMCIGDDAASTA